MTTRIRHRTPPTPYGCRWCGEARHHHGRSWVQSRGVHSWEQPTVTQIRARMRTRRAHHLTTKPVYHALTMWVATSDPEEGVPICAGCGSEACAPWLRVQRRLGRIRWGIQQPPSITRGGGWGGIQPW